MAKPNLFIIGAPKCGTTSLAGFLAQHPDIYLPLVEEAHLFDSLRSDVPQSRAEAFYSGRRAQRAWRCDASPTYLARYRTVIPMMEAMYDRSERERLRFLVMLRDPVERLRSHILHNTHRLTETRSLDQVASDELRELERGVAPERLEYMWPGFYGEQLGTWFDTFSPGQFVVLGMACLSHMADAASVLETFLSVRGLDDLPVPWRNRGGAPRSRILARALTTQNWASRLVKRCTTESVRTWIRLNLTSLNANPEGAQPRFSEEVRQTLQTFYQPHQSRLFRLLVHEGVRTVSL
jgi:hypothetical protein